MTNTKILFVAAVAALAGSALAGAEKGQFSVVLPGGKVVTGKQKTTVTLAAGQTLTIKGKFVEFLVDGDTFAVRNYTLTGAERRDGVTRGIRTTVFASRTPLLASKLTSSVSVELNNEQLVLRRSGAGFSLKIQAKDRTRGDLLGLETNRAIDVAHQLAPSFTYTVDAFNRVLLTNGAFMARESPRAATLKTPALSAIKGKSSSVWTIQANGQMELVIGEDATQQP